ncbi:hypothetical protein V6N12_035920 [Hibiscus sabdariffa]|uniref:Protein kinase domain-containing protein n=1 Tax=Hibiscus sabdariffa TaxID=183260 RepID=A0ABR2EPK1_9ROSI
MTDVSMVSGLDSDGIVVEWTKVKNLGSGSYGQVHLAKLSNLISGDHLLAAVKSCAYSRSASIQKELHILRQFEDSNRIVECFGDVVREVPKAGIFGNSTAVFLSESLKLCGGVPELGLSKCDSPGKKSGGSRLRIVLIASFASVAFIMASMLVLWFVTRKKDPGLHQVKEEVDSQEIYPMYRQHDLIRATRNFSSNGDMDLQKWVSMHLPGNFRDIVDHELKQNEWQPAHDDGIGRMLKIGLMCARKLPEDLYQSSTGKRC